MTAPILYCGDTTLESAASYLAGLITHFGWAFDYVPSHVKLTHELLARPHSLVILSDYPASQLDNDLQQRIIEQVEQGTGLLMIGGWESFHGYGGNWDTAPLAQALPVEISPTDDRINFDQPALLHPAAKDRKLWGLPWFERPPTVGGLNQIQPRRDSEVWLMATRYAPRFDVATGAIQWPTSGESFPALVTSSFGQGRTAAFATDVAPHWVGGFVDWGPTRVSAQAPGAQPIEVGSSYAAFWQQLLSWTGRLVE